MFNLFKSHKPDYTRLEHLEPEHSHYFVVNWCLGNLCNYACTYCPKGLHDGSQAWTELETIKNFADQVLSHYGPGKKYFFEFTGGEVTLYKDLIPLLQFLKSKGIRTGIISNGSRAMPLWQKIRPLLDSICLSFHPQSADTAHFLKVAEFLSPHVRVHLNFMMDPDNFEKSRDAALRAKEIPDISIALQPLTVNLGSKHFRYSDEQKAVFAGHSEITGQIRRTKHFETFRGTMATVDAGGNRVKQDPHQFIVKKQNSWRGWSCNAGLEQIIVNMGGKVYRGWCKVGGSLGHVRDKKISFPDKPVVCSRRSCDCNFDIMSAKEYVK